VAVITKPDVSQRLLPKLMVAGVLAASLLFQPTQIELGTAAVCTVGPGGAPTVTGVSPNFSSILGGNSVTITGCGFTGATAVNYGTTPAIRFTTNSDFDITAITPTHAVGAVDITVTTPLGTSATSPADVFNFYQGPCRSAAISASPASPQAPGTIVTLTASSTGCPNPHYKFWLMAPGGAWTALTSYGADTFSWDTIGLAMGVYQIGVWAQENLGGAPPNSYEAYYIATYTLSVDTCTAASLSTVTVSPAPAGTLVTWTATATRCPGASFRFWVQPQGGSWTMTRDYGASTWMWHTTGLSPGTYEVGVWALQAGSTNSYDAYGITTFVVGTNLCASAFWTPTVSPPQVPGVTVTFIGSSAGCVNPQYQFWLLPPGGSWTIKQPYSPTATWAWNTTGYALGTYQVGLWVKAGASTAGYDAFFIGTYQLDVGTCTSAGITASPSTPQAGGTSITLTASVSGCASPVFEFWELPPPGTTWSIVRTFGAGNTFVWNTTGLAPGNYRLGVWAKQAGSANAYDSYAILTIQIT
jgi:hypothetical protein